MGPEQPAEVPLADARKIGENGRREVAVKVLGDMLDDVAHDVVRRCRRCDVHAHLGLCPRALHVGDQRPGHPPRDVGTVVLGDERQGEVQRARHPADVATSAVADEDRIRVDGDRRVLAGEPVGVRPVRGGAAAVEQAGRGQHRRPGAHRRHPARVAGEPPDVRDEHVVGRRAPVSVAADHDERCRPGRYAAPARRALRAAAPAAP